MPKPIIAKHHDLGNGFSLVIAKIGHDGQPVASLGKNGVPVWTGDLQKLKETVLGTRH